MSRASALARLASACMRDGLLLQYAPGESLVTSVLLGGQPGICLIDRPETPMRFAAEFDPSAPMTVASPIERHYFDALKFESLDGNPPGWGYMVDPRS